MITWRHLVKFFLVILGPLTWQTGLASTVQISVGTDLFDLWRADQQIPFVVQDTFAGVVLLKLNERDLQSITTVAHQELGRCGGFFYEEPSQEKLDFLRVPPTAAFQAEELYGIDQKELVSTALTQVDGSRVFAQIADLAAFSNRYYNTDSGVSSQEFLYDNWRAFALDKDYVEVTKVDHSRWPQPSVILTIRGKTQPDEIIILGGHGDSKAFGVGDALVAPGADDNASGIAALWEVASVLMSQGFRGNRTIQIMSYAAEEVGLRGSDEIASSYKRSGKKVVGVFQLDMVNYHGSDYDMVLMSDYTNRAQNLFIESLLSEYLPLVKLGYDKCGYACSDHASWSRQGYAASIPFEATLRTKNPRIHTRNDLLENSNTDAAYAENFVKLALAYAIELAM